ncbi:MAG: hypothetical protein KGZ66_09390 [Selenomonadales bacterium]|nr:hypothetical protein [Selenomonadales bacterium]MBS3985798.1 hypothetical protein [Selenomonadales bacterium]
MSKQSKSTPGTCFQCGKSALKTAMKNHVLKSHNDGDELCYLIKAEGMHDKNYWLLFSLPLSTTLAALDKFLRQIWCECCGHLSAFWRDGHQLGETRKVSTLSIGDKLQYEYDFGSTTEILLTVLDEISRPKQREKVCLLARNNPHGQTCDTCGAPATATNAWEFELLCEQCCSKAQDEAAVLPIVNSPRCGVCGYTGEQDRWTSPNSTLPLGPEKVVK